jgi:NAD(P)-dependent dehydrogenase (short-subunit alcohol dehydrogenase family)
MQRRQVMSNKLKGKVALVTGGTSGIGLATAKRFAQEDARVYATGRRQSELDKAVQVIGTGTIGIQGDISRTGDLDRLYAQIKSEKGRLDILFANAGGGSFARLGEITEEQVDIAFGTNVKGILFTVQKALPLMKEGGSIIFNASTTSIKGMANFSVYSATKAAVRSFAHTWSSDLKGRGIRVNAVSPGVIVTPAFDALLGNENIKGFTDDMAGQIPLGRVGKEEEVAGAVAFLASDDARYITGIELFVDDGMTQL